jgi:polyisoprenoid-binding protein YceI
MTTATALPTGTWNVDPAHSHVTFTVRHIGISKVRGSFGEYEGTLVFGDDGTLTATGTIQTASINTSQPGRDDHLRGEDFFDVENHPTITYSSTSVTPTGDGTFDVVGDLTIRGVTKPITLGVTLGGTETDAFGIDRVGLEATGEILRSDFGMTFNMPLGSGALVLSDKIKIDIDVSAIKAS